MQEFKVNDLLTLKLENSKTVIYVKGKKFRQCMYLLVNKKVDELEDLLTLDSVEDLVEDLDHSLGEGENHDEIPPEVEFWGHCSNIQVWYENGYNTRMIHSNLAFPLLRRLSNVGDVIAKRVFKEEIAKRLATGYPSVVKYLIEERYIKYLTREELLFGILEPEEAEVITKLNAMCGENFYLTHKFYDNLDLSFIVMGRHVIGLTLSFFKLKTFPEEITKLKFIKKLYLGGNRFSNIPESIRNLKNLQTLLIFDNNLNCLPESIGNLKSLRLLDLEKNMLKHIPESIGNLVSLEELILNFNQIVELPEAVLELNSLKKLHLRGVFLARTISATEKNLNIIKKLEVKGVNIITEPPRSGNLPRYIL